MRNFSYSTFTKKQANILYFAVKRGQLEMSKSEISRMYDLVGKNMLDADEATFKGQLTSAISHYLEGRTDCAQARLDGKKVEEVKVIDGYTERVADEDDWFEEPGTIIREEISHTEWVIR